VLDFLLPVPKLLEPNSCHFSDVKIIKTTSTKINYLLDKLRSHPSEKAIIFSSVKNTLYYLGHSLNAAGFKFLAFYSGLKSQEKGQAITTFNTNEAIKIFLMDTDLAAYGINLVSASRIYFVDPVIDPKKKQQAIKRAHRIGQLQSVHVEMIIMNDTIEQLQENISLKLGNNFELKKEETHTRELLTTLQFLPQADEPKLTLNIEPFKKNKAQTLDPSSELLDLSDFNEKPRFMKKDGEKDEEKEKEREREKGKGASKAKLKLKSKFKADTKENQSPSKQEKRSEIGGDSSSDSESETDFASEVETEQDDDDENGNRAESSKRSAIRNNLLKDIIIHEDGNRDELMEFPECVPFKDFAGKGKGKEKIEKGSEKGNGTKLKRPLGGNLPAKKKVRFDS